MIVGIRLPALSHGLVMHCLSVQSRRALLKELPLPMTALGRLRTDGVAPVLQLHPHLSQACKEGTRSARVAQFG